MTNSQVSLVSASATRVLGEYDHRFSIEEDGGFAILYGPNGVGKTRFLETIHAISRLNGASLIRLPFEKAKLVYSDGSSLEATRDSNFDAATDEEWQSSASVEITLKRKGAKPVKWSYGDDDFDEWVRMSLPYQPIGDGFWEDPGDGEIVHTDELRDRYRRRSPNPNKAPDVMQEFVREVPSFLIETQRLRIEQSQRGARPQAWRSPSGAKPRRQHTSRITEQAATIRKLVNDAQTEHSRITQQLDRTFPNRVLETNADELQLDAADIRKRYNDQNSFRSRLGRVASVALDDALSLPERRLDDWELKLLNLYLDDADLKLAPFEELLQKIELLEQIINSRLLNKQLQVTDGDGLFVQRKGSGRSISLDSLSSGEQHEIIVMIDLLFNVPSGAVVLIDEPEISLHIVWQLAFIPDVKRIAALAGFRFVVATHSPQIINDEWDRAFRLGPPEEAFA
ncbi:AAA family ATPase [Curtobacterium sp. ME-Dv--P-122a]|uniref:AAA family ATPase n=1 Tax=Curtobacterium sp. ME-Dv--P-122a TaxID=3040286 RepID=UPI00254C2B66|nr:AAA family ATPase [Curtobacterium sp. ME-Dv--P-122a]